MGAILDEALQVIGKHLDIVTDTMKSLKLDKSKSEIEAANHTQTDDEWSHSCGQQNSKK
jgi:hypothetical protein